MNNTSIRMKIWNIIFPLIVNEAVLSFAMLGAKSFLGNDSSVYMLCQIIGTVVTLPIIYLVFYKEDQKIGLTTRLSNHIEENKLAGKRFWSVPINVIFILLISALFCFALNNILIMTPLARISSGFKEANDNFFGSTVLVELIASAMLTPLLEELLFRGVIYSRLRSYFDNRKYIAVFLSAFCFGIIHLNLVQFIYALVFGIVITLFMEKTGHLYGAILGHAFANGISVVRVEYGFLSGWCDGSRFAWMISLASLIVGCIVLGIYMLKGNQK